MIPKIHYHSDCPFFAGCENMLVNFFSSPEIKDQFKLSFSYRASKSYSDGLKHRARIDFPTYPQRFPELSNPSILSKKIPFIIRRGIMFFLRLIWTFPLLSYQVWVLQRLFQQLQPDIVHINNGGYPAALSARAAVIAARITGVKHIIMVVNNLAIDYQRFSRWWEYPLDKFVAHNVTKFVTGSHAAGNQLKEVLRLQDDSMQPIHNGIAIRSANESLCEVRKRLGLEYFDGVLLGVVALMDPRKGHQILLEALIQCLRDRPNGAPAFKLLLEGDGPLRVELEQFVLVNHLSEHCVFVGSESNVMNFMTLLDVLILPSVCQEDFPNVIIEAMALGKPVIASRIAGTPEQIVDGKTGILVEPRNPEQLATALQKIVADEVLRLRMGEAGRQRFQQYFTADVAVGNYVSLYQSMIMR